MRRIALSAVCATTLVVAMQGCGPKPPAKVVVLPSPGPMAELWIEPSDLGSRDLFHGIGGPSLAPDPARPFVFVEQKTSGSPGYTVADAGGLRWSVKMGVEAQAEVAVSRLLWAIGFHQPPVYLLPSWTLEGGPEPGPKGPGRFRPHLPGWKNTGSWLWRQNPYVGTRPLKGLVVFMRIVNNWDLLDRNNEVYALDPSRDGVHRYYAVRDLGASLGHTTALGRHQGTKNDVEGFESQEYLEKVEDGFVHFDNKGRRHRDLHEKITVDDVKWTSELLARLTPQQWQDAFRAAHYDQETAARYIGRLRQKVDEGRALR
jgi:hypothetical protein